MRHDALRLGAFFYATGHHVAGWRHPSSEADGGLNLERYVGWARRADDSRVMLFTPRGELAWRALWREPVNIAASAAPSSPIGLASV